MIHLSNSSINPFFDALVLDALVVRQEILQQVGRRSEISPPDFHSNLFRQRSFRAPIFPAIWLNTKM